MASLGSCRQSTTHFSSCSSTAALALQACGSVSSLPAAEICASTPMAGLVSSCAAGECIVCGSSAAVGVCGSHVAALRCSHSYRHHSGRAARLRGSTCILPCCDMTMLRARISSAIPQVCWRHAPSRPTRDCCYHGCPSYGT